MTTLKEHKGQLGIGFESVQKRISRNNKIRVLETRHDRQLGVFNFGKQYESPPDLVAGPRNMALFFYSTFLCGCLISFFSIDFASSRMLHSVASA